MLKSWSAVVLFALHVCSLNTFAADQADIQKLVEDSRAEAQYAVNKQLIENERMIREIVQLERKIEELKSEMAQNTGDMKRDFIIAGGTALGASLLAIYLGTRPVISEGSIVNLLLARVVVILGGTMTVSMAAKGTYHSVLVHVDKKNLPVLEEQLAKLKKNLAQQNAALNQ